jgi:hypothetical protein
MIHYVNKENITNREKTNEPCMWWEDALMLQYVAQTQQVMPSSGLQLSVLCDFTAGYN